jgi:predicted protein tyrosine phosphatase
MAAAASSDPPLEIVAIGDGMWSPPTVLDELLDQLFPIDIKALVRHRKGMDPGRIWPPLTDDSEEHGFALYLGSRKAAESPLTYKLFEVDVVCSILDPYGGNIRNAVATVSSSREVEHHVWEIEDCAESRHAILPVLNETLEVIRKAREDGRKVLVHCQAGVSRSGSCVLAWIMAPVERGGMGLGLLEAAKVLRAGRPIARPNVGFFTSVMFFIKELNKSPPPVDDWTERAYTDEEMAEVAAAYLDAIPTTEEAEEVTVTE